MKWEKHLDFEDYMELTETVLNTGGVEEMDERMLDHLKNCPDCNATAAAFLSIHRYIEKMRQQERDGMRRQSGQRNF